jgi:photosystem II stability/assembly factor-like uncharacterized protein
MSRSFCFLSLLVANLLLLAAPPLYSSWQHLPADGPWLQAIVADSSGQRILVSAQRGGVWQSENGGATWQPISDHFVPEGGVEVPRLFELDALADTVFAPRAWRYQDADGSRYSTNGGQSWQVISDPFVRVAEILEAYHFDHDVWLALNDTPTPSFRTSSDCGVTWSLGNELATEYIIGMYQDPLRDSTLYVSCSYEWHGYDRGGLMRTEDLGATWSSILPIYEATGITAAWVTNVLRMTNGELLATVSGYSRRAWIFVSANDGQTWDSVSALPAYIFDEPIVEDSGFPGRLFMAYSTVGGIMRSDDYGRTWTQASGELPDVLTQPRDLYQNRFSGVLYAIYDLYGIYRSIDHGETWHYVSPPPIGMPVATFSFTPEATFTGSYSWEPRAFRQWQLEFPNGGWHSYTIVLEDLDTLRGASLPWYKNGDSLLAYAEWSPVDEAWDIPPHAAIMLSTDNGLTWTEAPPLVTALDFYRAVVQRTDISVTIFATNVWKGTGGQDSLFMSSDRGVSWQFRSIVPEPETFLKIAGQGDTLIALVGSTIGYQSRVWRSTNTGLSWTRLGNQYMTTTNLIPLGEQIIALDQDHSVLWRDGTWEARGEVPESYFGVWWEMIALPSNPPILLGVTGDSNVLWVSRDTAMTWDAHEAELPFETQSTGLTEISYDSYRNRVWVYAGTGACYMDASELSTDGPLQFVPADYTLLAVYPNPFNAETKIRFDLLKREQVTVRLYDLLGREVKTVLEGMQEAGRHEISLSVPKLASGVYFLRLDASEQTRTAKIMVLK